MREGPYKFRAWHPQWREYIELSNLSLEYNGSWHLSTDINGKVQYHWFKKTDVQIEEYTGLKDKTEKEIYEGDVLFSTNDIMNYEVKFYKGMYCVYMPDSDTYSPLYEYTEDGIVVGSVVKNPEILNKPPEEFLLGKKEDELG
jgi:UPF0288 family protein (methanogenesis marker protein 3)